MGIPFLSFSYNPRIIELVVPVLCPYDPDVYDEPGLGRRDGQDGREPGAPDQHDGRLESLADRLPEGAGLGLLERGLGLLEELRPARGEGARGAPAAEAYRRWVR